MAAQEELCCDARDTAHEANVKAEKALTAIDSHDKTCVELARQMNAKIDKMDEYNRESHSRLFSEISRISTRMWVLVVAGLGWIITTVVHFVATGQI